MVSDFDPLDDYNRAIEDRLMETLQYNMIASEY